MSTESTFDTPEQFEEESQKSADTLEREIDQQRSSIGNLVDALEKRMSPGQLVDQALGYVKGTGGETFTNLGNQIKANPLAVALTAVGVLWLMTGSRTPSPGPSVLDKVSDKVSGVADSVAGSLGDAKARVQQTAARVKDKAGELTGSATHALSGSVPDTHAAATLREKGRQVQSSASNLLHEQPLMVAVIGIALGAAIGAALPTSEPEKKLVNLAREKLNEPGLSDTDPLSSSIPRELTADAGMAGMQDSDIVGVNPASRPGTSSAPQPNHGPASGSTPGLG
jgi:ElaB/YqjD/DUF883 family membrane-anchored ribosome-binding protein